MTGPAASFGIPEHKTFKYFVQKANKNGGINGHKIVVFYRDDQTSPTQATKVARDLVRAHNVDVIVGPTTGSEALAVGALLPRFKVPMLSPTSTIAVTAKDSGFYEWAFRTCFNQKQTISTVFDYMKDKGYNRIGLFFQQDAYGNAAAKRLKKLTSQNPEMKIVGEASAPLNVSDLTVQATKLAAVDPSVVLIQSDVAKAGAALLRGLHQAHSTAPVLVVGALVTQTFLNVAGDTAEGIVAPFGGIGWDKPTPTQARFIKGYGQPNSFGPALAGTAFMAIKAAVSNMEGGITGSSLRDALEHVCGFPTLSRSTGCYSPDNHNGRFKTAASKVVNGQWVTMEE
jgi:branched-chain amino acid transport system substrate-binding protein